MLARRHGQLATEKSSRTLAALATKAITLADEQADRTSSAIARTLYEYNRLPLTRFWLHRWPNDAAVSDMVRRSVVAGKGYHEIPVPTPGWLQWRARASGDHKRGAGRVKLYVSPRPEAVADAIALLVPVLERHGSPIFKVGADAYGLLRPDKIVVYLPDTASAHSLARDLSAELLTCPSQGVPFTAAAGPGALLSWGIDPPSGTALGDMSWRLWIATQLAQALFNRDRAIGTGAAVRACLTGIGVDPRSWAPTPALTQRFLPAPPRGYA